MNELEEKSKYKRLKEFVAKIDVRNYMLDEIYYLYR